MDRWWANCIRDESERTFVREQIDKVRRREEVWTRQMYENALKTRKKAGSLGRTATSSERTN